MNPSSLPNAKSFRDLIVYQRQRQLSREVFKVSKSFPPEEKFSLTDQIRRSARSVGAQIAESWAKRRYERHFLSKLSDADAEQMETQHWLETAKDDGYLSATDCARLLGLCEEIGRMLGSMMERSSSFCDSASLHDEPVGYNCSDPSVEPDVPTDH